MKRRFSIVPLFAISTLFLNGATHGLLQHEKFQPSADSNVLTGRYIVEFNHQDSTYSFAQTLSRAFGKDVKINEQFTHDLFSGLSFYLNDPTPSAVTASSYDNKLQALFDHDFVMSVYPIRAIQRPHLTSKPVHEDGSLAKAISPHHLTQVDRVHKELKHSGKGIVVGIIDSGVDYYHPALGGGFGKGHKVSLG